MPSPTDISIRLREQAAKSLDPHIEKLNGLLQDLKDSVGSSLEGMEQCVRHMRSYDFGGVEAFITEALQEAVAAGRQGAHEERERDLDFLAHFARDVRKKETQEEILSLLL
ncbi:MAG: hypothetical protein FJW35_05185, partial [Acidobacteria bacterium]|nr:hypothetical protein [Acidobacteriota bacterium]